MPKRTADGDRHPFRSHQRRPTPRVVAPKGEVETMTSRARSGIGNGGKALAVFAFAAFFATSSSAADIADLRVGDHADYTRVVLELSEAAGYRLVVPQEGGPAEIVMQVNAAGRARLLATKSSLVREVSIDPAERGSTVRIGLSTTAVKISEMILSQPPRIVLDVRPSDPIAQTAAAGSSQDTVAVVVPSLRQEAAAKTDPVPQVPAAMPPGDGSTSAADTAPPIEPKLATDEIAVASAEAASDAETIGDAMADGVQAAEMASDPPPLPKAAPPRPPVIKTAKRPGSASAEAESEPWLSRPVMVGVGVFAVVMMGWMFMRRRSAADDDPLFPIISADDVDGDEVVATDESHESMAADDEVEAEDTAGVTEPTPFTATHGIAASQEIPVESGQMEFGQESTSVDVSDEDSTTASDSIFAAVEAVEAEIAEPPQSAANEGLSKRILELESRLESLTESRERLERQVAAQTEELRVQRAAIARTQRVVRSLSKGEDEVSEPVPRQPN